MPQEPSGSSPPFLDYLAPQGFCAGGQEPGCAIVVVCHGTLVTPALVCSPATHSVQVKPVSWGFFLFPSFATKERFQNPHSRFPATFQK